jgi:hypothetical protein
MKDRDATAVRNTRTYSRKPTLLLDVGPGKTGSSAIQAWLARYSRGKVCLAHAQKSWTSRSTASGRAAHGRATALLHNK